MFNNIKIAHLLTICFLLTCQLCYTQTYMNNEFVYPLEKPLILSGNFGEFRNNHFHSGIDIKTNGKSGAPVKCIENGYVSRIKISHGGFGKALYIRHPNGLTSVYAHLQEFNKEINAYVKKRQYEKESYTIELFPDAKELVVNKSQIIALSGNTGGSYGPHLHFEIRNTATEHPVNPHLHGIHVTDKEIPLVSKVMLVPYDEENEIYLFHKAVELSINTANTKSILKDTILTTGVFGVQFYGYDIASTSSNRLGVYKIKLLKDKLKCFEVTFNEFSFSESRYVNACIDYPAKKNRQQTWTRCYLLPNNRFSEYNTSKLDGMVRIDDDETHRITLIIEDFYGNKKEISIPVKRDNQASTIANADTKYSKMLYWNKDNRFICEGLELNFSANSFYNDVAFQYKEFPKTTETYSPIYSLHNDTEPVHNYFNIKINVSENNLANKLLIALKDNNAYYYEGGKVENGSISTKVRSFGNYTVIADTLSPTLAFLKMPQKGKSSTLVIKLKDDLSGIKSYKTLINKKWLLMEYDPKANKMIGDINDLNLSGKITIECSAVDEKQNENRISKSIIW